jgi:hypothetical protein
MTAKEFLKKYLENNPEGKYDDCMVEFAQMHVMEALRQASEQSYAVSSASNITSKSSTKGVQGLICVHLGKVSVNKDSILNAYPLDKIK